MPVSRSSPFRLKSSSMVGIVAVCILAPAAAFSNVWIYRQVVPPKVVGRMQRYASLRQDFAGVDTFPFVGARLSVAASAVFQCAVLAASAATSRRARRLVAQERQREAAPTTKRVVLVTGANKGIGKEIARSLGQLPDHAVVLGARDEALVRRRMNNELNFPLNFERLVLGCIDADFCE